jgi:lipoyl(octanoyl) transferase
MKRFFDSLNLPRFELNESHLSTLDERTLVVTKWNWDYALAHQFQRLALSHVQENRNQRILICTSHPEVLTNGRGLQKPRKGETLNLVEFTPGAHKNLPYPFFQIERGGGLTFHHPGQFVFYPIVALNPATLSLSHMIDQIFDFSIDVLKDWKVPKLHHEHKLLGLWSGEKKLASMGIAIEKLVTFHGMALNLEANPRMKIALQGLNPCGLDSNTYSSVEELGELPPNSHGVFRERFLQRIQHEWK